MSLPSDLEVGDRIRIIKEGIICEGILMPSTEFSSKDIIIVKLPNGYNVGISVEGAKVEIVEKRAVKIEPEKEEKISLIKGKDKAKISLVSTGGTIASKVEYETGAVRPAINADELIEMVPELLQFGDLEVIDLFRLLSEDMTFSHWSKIAEVVAQVIRNGARGVIIAHGTDTMTYTAAALAFALRKLPVTVSMVGAQRSSDRPSSDAALNLKAAAIAASKAPFGEVTIVMHGYTSDSYALVHRGVKVRKMHSSRRDAFQSINDVPLAKVLLPKGELKLLTNRYIPRSDLDALELMPRFESKVALVKTYPGFACDMIDFLVDKGYRGIVLEGTGLGHIPQRCIKSVRRAIESDIIVAMTTQTLFGRVNMKVYTNGRKLIEAGVISGEDMLPEVAYVKLSWLLGNYDTETARKLFQRNLVNEINELHDIRHYPRWFHGD
jgi:glutamyl-tRNA(Gln) amidotransferase subunit D